MAVFRAPVLKFQGFDLNGDLLTGGLLYTYSAGTTTLQSTFTSSAGVTENTNPIVLNSRGEAPSEIWLSEGIAYKFVLKTAANVTIWTEDNVRGVGDTVAVVSEWSASGLTPNYISATSFSVPGDRTTTTFPVGRRVKATTSGGTRYGSIRTSTFGSGVTTVVLTLDSGSLDSGLSAVSVGILDASNTSLPAFLQTGTGSVPRNINAKLGDELSAKDFGALGDGTTDDTTAIQAAITAAVAAGGADIKFPRGTYRVTATLTIPSQSHIGLIGDGMRATTLDWRGGNGSKMIHIATTNPGPATSSCSVKGMTLINGGAATTAVGIQVNPSAGGLVLEFAFEDLLFNAWTGTALQIYGEADEFTLKHIWIFNSAKGIQALGGANSNWVWNNVHIHGCSDWSADLTGMSGHVFNGLYLHGSVAAMKGLKVDVCDGASVNGFYFENSASGCVGPAIHVGATAYGTDGMSGFVVNGGHIDFGVAGVGQVGIKGDFVKGLVIQGMAYRGVETATQFTSNCLYPVLMPCAYGSGVTNKLTSASTTSLVLDPQVTGGVSLPVKVTVSGGANSVDATTGSLAHNTTTALFAVAANETYDVQIYDENNDRFAFGRATRIGSNALQVYQVHSTHAQLVLTASTNSVAVNQTSGGNITVRYVATKIRAT